MFGKTLIISVMTVLAIALLCNSAYASTALTGTVTRCSGYYSCSFAVNNDTGTGYVTIYGASVSFKLPRESNVTTSSVLPYGFSAQIVKMGSSSAGTLYNVTGTFTATDATNGRLVNGSTDVIVAAKTICWRTCGISYKTINGSINVFETDKISGQSITTVTCNPSSIIQGTLTTCTASVTNLATQNTIIPTGAISFTASNVGLGTFSQESCNMISGTCSVNFKSNEEGSGTTSIYASYMGDSLHTSSLGSTLVYVTPSSNDDD